MRKAAAVKLVECASALLVVATYVLGRDNAGAALLANTANALGCFARDLGHG